MRNWRGALAAAGAALCVAAMAAEAPGQDAKQDALRKKYEEKVAESWFREGGWTDDFHVAKSKAMVGNKPILAYFTRSYSP